MDGRSAMDDSDLEPVSDEDLEEMLDDVDSDLMLGDADLEPVSDDDLDEMLDDADPLDAASDAQSSSQRRILDSLEIDWSTLISQPKKSEREPIARSARERCSAANVLATIGFSQSFAGQSLSREVIAFCTNELKDNFTSFMDPVASRHCFLREKQKERSNLFDEGNSLFSTALSARKDMIIRRLLKRNAFGSLQNETVSDNQQRPANDENNTVVGV
ncbi:hypothetical protein HDE_10532 [Halotydeus destructor]|nr:hypothetical protein HDE_10532 [Halotydeus destructor]